MSFENRYPYTDFHELNLDWFLQEFNNLLTKWADLAADNAEFKQTMTERFGTLSDTVHEFTTFVTNYFDNLDVQQEINNKLNDMVEDGTLSELLRPYFNAFTVEINARMRNQDDRISVLEGRMDTFTHLTDGSTSGDAELQDIRVGANGVTYPTAGDAVRGQYTQLKNDMNIILFTKAINAVTGTSYWNQGISYANHDYIVKNETNANITVATYASDKTTLVESIGNISGNSSNEFTLSSDAYYMLIYARADGNVSIIDKTGNLLGSALKDISDLKDDVEDNTSEIEENSNKISSLAEANDCSYVTISRNLINMNFMEGKTIRALAQVVHSTWMIPVPINNKLSSGTKYRLGFWVNNGSEVIPLDNTQVVFRIYDTSDDQIIERIYTTESATFSHNITSSNYGYVQFSDASIFDYTIVGCMLYNTTEDPTVATEYIPFEEGYVKNNSDDFVTIGTGGDFNTVKEGFEFAVENNKKVKILPGVYDLVTEGIENTANGYKLPKEVHGYGAVLVCRLANENWSISPLNVNDECSETKLYGLTVIAENCRYCIHDEMGESDLDYYHNVFKDLKLVHESAQSATLLAPQSIGGGMGNGGYVEIENCVCQCVFNKDIAYHSYSHKEGGEYIPQTVDGTIIIKDCYLSGRPAAASVSDYTSAMNTMYVSNCSLGESIQHAADTNMTLKDWNNVVRS